MVPTKDVLLVAWSTNANDRITASPATWQLTPAQAAAYTALHQPYLDRVAELNAARAEGTRSMSMRVARDDARSALLAYARELYAAVQASTSVSDADKTLLGVRVRKSGKTNIPAPAVAPGVSIVSVVARTVTARIYDGVTKRGKPAGARVAWVYSFVGAEWPSDPRRWYFEGATGRETHAIRFDDAVPAGAQVWLRAAWVSAKGEVGPACVPITTHLQFGGLNAAAGLKIAA